MKITNNFNEVVNKAIYRDRLAIILLTGLLALAFVILSGSQVAQGASSIPADGFEYSPGFTHTEQGYVTTGPGYQALISEQGVSFEFFDGSASMLFSFKEGSVQDVRTQGESGTFNFLLGKDSSKWRSHRYDGERLLLKEVWPKIDVEFYHDKDGRLEYDFILGSGADLEQINFEYAGSDALSVSAGVLLAGRLEQSLPEIYHYEYGGAKVVYTGRHELVDGGFSIAVDDYAAGGGLVIDPVVDYERTGGTGENKEKALATAFDAEGNAYEAGITYNSRKYLAASGLDQAGIYPSGGRNAYVAKYDQDGTLLWLSFIGGTDLENGSSGMGLAVDSNGRVWLSGSTKSDDFPVTDGSSLGGNYDGFLVRLSPDGGNILYGTYLGGSRDDRALNLALSKDERRVYVVGLSRSANVFDYYNEGGSLHSAQPDALIASYEITGDEVSLDYAKRLGGRLEDRATDVVENPVNGGIYVVGDTRGFFAGSETTSAYDENYGGVRDGFIMRMSPEGEIESLGYYGGSGSDRIRAATIDEEGRLYVAGFSNSSDLPGGVFSGENYAGGGWNGFMGVLVEDESDEMVLLYSDYIGGDGNDYAFDVEIDGEGQVVLLGYSDSRIVYFGGGLDLRNDRLSHTTHSTAARASGNGLNVWVAKWGGFWKSIDWLGGEANDRGYRLAVAENRWLLAGKTESIAPLHSAGSSANIGEIGFIDEDSFILALTDDDSSMDLFTDFEQITEFGYYPNSYHEDFVQFAVGGFNEAEFELVDAPAGMEMFRVEAGYAGLAGLYNGIQAYVIVWTPTASQSGPVEIMIRGSLGSEVEEFKFIFPDSRIDVDGDGRPDRDTQGGSQTPTGPVFEAYDSQSGPFPREVVGFAGGLVLSLSEYIEADDDPALAFPDSFGVNYDVNTELVVNEYKLLSMSSSSSRRRRFQEIASGSVEPGGVITIAEQIEPGEYLLDIDLYVEGIVDIVQTRLPVTVLEHALSLSSNNYYPEDHGEEAYVLSVVWDSFPRDASTRSKTAGNVTYRVFDERREYATMQGLDLDETALLTLGAVADFSDGDELTVRSIVDSGDQSGALGEIEATILMHRIPQIPDEILELVGSTSSITLNSSDQLVWEFSDGYLVEGYSLDVKIESESSGRYEFYSSPLSKTFSTPERRGTVAWKPSSGNGLGSYELSHKVTVVSPDDGRTNSRKATLELGSYYVNVSSHALFRTPGAIIALAGERYSSAITYYPGFVFGGNESFDYIVKRHYTDQTMIIGQSLGGVENSFTWIPGDAGIYVVTARAYPGEREEAYAEIYQSVTVADIGRHYIANQGNVLSLQMGSSGDDPAHIRYRIRSGNRFYSSSSGRSGRNDHGSYYIFNNNWRPTLVGVHTLSLSYYWDADRQFTHSLPVTIHAPLRLVQPADLILHEGDEHTLSVSYLDSVRPQPDGVAFVITDNETGEQIHSGTFASANSSVWRVPSDGDYRIELSAEIHGHMFMVSYRISSHPLLEQLNPVAVRNDDYVLRPFVSGYGSDTYRLHYRYAGESAYRFVSGDNVNLRFSKLGENVVEVRADRAGRSYYSKHTLVVLPSMFAPRFIAPTGAASFDLRDGVNYYYFNRLRPDELHFRQVFNDEVVIDRIAPTSEPVWTNYSGSVTVSYVVTVGGIAFSSTVQFVPPSLGIGLSDLFKEVPGSTIYLQTDSYYLTDHGLADGFYPDDGRVQVKVSYPRGSNGVTGSTEILASGRIRLTVPIIGANHTVTYTALHRGVRRSISFPMVALPTKVEKLAEFSDIFTEGIAVDDDENIYYTGENARLNRINVDGSNTEYSYGTHYDPLTYFDGTLFAQNRATVIGTDITLRYNRYWNGSGVNQSGDLYFYNYWELPTVYFYRQGDSSNPGTLTLNTADASISSDGRTIHLSDEVRLAGGEFQQNFGRDGLYYWYSHSRKTVYAYNFATEELRARVFRDLRGSAVEGPMVDARGGLYLNGVGGCYIAYVPKPFEPSLTDEHYQINGGREIDCNSDPLEDDEQSPDSVRLLNPIEYLLSKNGEALYVLDRVDGEHWRDRTGEYIIYKYSR